jgi:cell division septal protein FtsQ
METKHTKWLSKSFGEDYIVLNAIKSLKEGGPVKSPSEKAEFADAVSTAVAIATGMNKLRENDSQRVIFYVNERMPNYLKVKWKKLAVEKKTSDGV